MLIFQRGKNVKVKEELEDHRSAEGDRIEKVIICCHLNKILKATFQIGKRRLKYLINKSKILLK